MQVSKNLPAIQKIIDKLEAKKWHIRMSHDPKNTRTTVFTIERGYRRTGHEFTGIARCTKNDQFSRATGTRVAFNRAIHKMSQALGRDAVKEILE